MGVKPIRPESVTAALFVAAIVPFFISPNRLARSKVGKAGGLTHRIIVRGRYPVRSDSGAILVTQRDALLTFAEQDFGILLNRVGGAFGLGMLFMLGELAFGGANIIVLQGYGYYVVTINYLPLTTLIVLPFLFELIGAGMIADARRKMKRPGWSVVLGELAALRGAPRTRIRAVLTKEEQDLLEQLEQGEDAGNIFWR